jgi:hypothetical protein
MPEWVQSTLHEEKRQAEELAQLDDLIFVSQINRTFHLAEPLYMTMERPWWDLLEWHLAIFAELGQRGTLSLG